MQALKAQINPHFLFNVLNNLLSITNRAGNEEASAVIVQLSEMMRFLLYDVAEKQIPIQKEIEFIHNFIELNQLRFSKKDDIKIIFEHPDISAHILMEPALFIPFVENAFKHGIDIFRPSFIKIYLSVNEKRHIDFRVENSIHNRKNKAREFMDNSLGIGLSNVKKRLNIAYPDRHELKIEEGEGHFKIHLKIQP